MSFAYLRRHGLTYREAQRVMIEQHGVRRSLDSIARDLRLWECPACAGRSGG